MFGVGAPILEPILVVGLVDVHWGTIWSLTHARISDPRKGGRSGACLSELVGIEVDESSEEALFDEEALHQSGTEVIKLERLSIIYLTHIPKALSVTTRLVPSNREANL